MRVNADLAEQRLHAEGARLVRDNRHHELADLLVLQQLRQHLDEDHRRRRLALGGALAELLEGVAEFGDDRLGADHPLRHRPMQRRAARLDVLHLDTVVGGAIERRVLDVIIRNRDAETGPERLHFIVVEFLLLVADVLAFARLADPVALDRAGQHQRGHALGVGGTLECVEHLLGIVTAERELLKLLVRQVLDHVEQPRIGAPEMLAHVGARLDGVLLVLAVDDLAHALHEQVVDVFLEQGVPFRAPDALDDVPARASEDGLEFLDDLAVAAYRAVEALQVAVDHEDQVIELFARRERDGAQ